MTTAQGWSCRRRPVPGFALVERVTSLEKAFRPIIFSVVRVLSEGACEARAGRLIQTDPRMNRIASGSGVGLCNDACQCGSHFCIELQAIGWVAETNCRIKHILCLDFVLMNSKLTKFPLPQLSTILTGIIICFLLDSFGRYYQSGTKGNVI